MSAKTACKKSVAVCNLDYVFVCKACVCHCTSNTFCPHAQVMSCVAYYSCFSCCAARSMDSYYFRHWASKKSERICVAQIVFFCIRKKMHIINTMNIFWLYSLLLHSFSVERDIVVNIVHNFYKTNILQVAKFSTAHTFSRLIPICHFIFSLFIPRSLKEMLFCSFQLSLEGLL